MRRFFVEDITEDSETVLIEGEEFTHLSKVLRLKAGDAVSVFNGGGLEIAGRIKAVEKGRAIVGVEGIVVDKKESPIEIILLQGLLKGEKPDFIVQKGVELGAKEIIFYASPRTVPALSREKINSRLIRWKKVAVEAAKQCGRNVIAGIQFKESISEAFEEIEKRNIKVKIALHERGGGKRLKEVLKDVFPNKATALLTGPEGGLSDKEAEVVSGHGFTLVKLGPRILRAETAAVAALSILQYELGDF